MDSGKPGKENRRKPDGWNELLVREEDYDLFMRICDYFRGKSDIDEVRSDPGFEAVGLSARELVSGYTHSCIKPGIRAFVMENSDDEIIGIREEINRNNLDEISSQWVEEWETKKRKKGSEEIREYITSTLGGTEKLTEPSSRKINLTRPLFMRYALSAAAVLTGVVFIVSVLVRSNDPGRMFEKYYKPLVAVSPVTRAGSMNGSERIAEAIDLYNKGDYNAAATGFSGIISDDPLLVQPRFYLGMSHFALGNYSDAATILEEVAGGGGEYMKEARWYLGLIYLKEGDKSKARENFQFLAHSEGFYSGRSEKILRRLR